MTNQSKGAVVQNLVLMEQEFPILVTAAALTLDDVEAGTVNPISDEEATAAFLKHLSKLKETRPGNEEFLEGVFGNLKGEQPG